MSTTYAKIALRLGYGLRLKQPLRRPKEKLYS